LIVPGAVRREAASAYIDEVALALDSCDEDLQVEGSIAKYFTTESANLAADQGIQALGGYGYITEFEIEKIKRDVKITCIYEGTSEIQQSIISTFRWKKSRKSKGAFYNGIVSEMAALNETHPDLGAGFYAICARALNELIDLAHVNRLTRQQHVMFALADLMTHVEVGAALARKAARTADAGDAATATVKTASRIFAAENVLTILMGTNTLEPEAVSAFLETIQYTDLMASYRNLVADMDQMADALFGR
jgi:alkylation response protein AidB-like acyl-CoA dehydrogenase